MKVLVTGGAGFIGSHVVDCLIKQGHRVSIIDNLISGKKENVNRAAKFYLGDIKDRKLLDKVFQSEKPEVMIHFAAQKSVTHSVDDPIFDATENIIGSLNVFEAAKRNHAQKIIFTSTGGALYGNADQIPTSETQPIYPESPYGIAKYAIEHYLRFYATNYPIKTIILRLANVYGERQDPKGEAGVVAIFCGKIINHQEPTIFGATTRDYIYVQDVARAIIKALACDENIIVNIGTGVESKVIDLVGYLSKEAGRSIKPKLKPKRPGELERSALDCSLAARKLSWQSETNLEVGLKQTFNWFKHHLGDDKGG